MKKITLLLNPSLRKFSLTALFLAGSLATWAQMEVIGKVKNLRQTAPDTYTFDVWLFNNSTNGAKLKLSGFQLGIDLNEAVISNGGQITARQLKQNQELPVTQRQQSPQISHLAKRRSSQHAHFRIAAQVVGAGNSQLSVEIPREGIWYGTYEIKNSVPFAANSKPMMTWNLMNAQGKTRSLVLCYVNDQVTSTRFTNPATEGNLFKVESDQEFTLNPSSKVSAAVNGTETTFSSIYPNPAHEQITLDIQSVQSGSVNIEILDAGGRVVLVEALQLEVGTVKKSIDIKSLASGTYSVRMKLRERDLISRFIKE